VSGNYYLFGANLGVPPLDNKTVRQALNYAINRKRFTDTLLMGTGTPSALPWPSKSPAYDATAAAAYGYDLDKARSLLQQAGVGSFTIDCNVNNSFPLLVDFATVYQADLAQLGITLNVRTLELATWVDQAVNRKYQGLYLSNAPYAQLEPSSALSNGRATDPNSNNSGFDNDQYKQLVASAASEPDATKRKALYDQINALLLDESFIMAISSGPPTLVMKPNVSGIVPSVHDGFYYQTAWLA
jgi:peptide/nickel transport system substrate-binding protein